MSKEYTTDNIYIDGYLSDGSGSGTSGQVLSSTGGGVSWVDGSGTIIGGPYLPLAGGTLTGDLFITQSNTDTVPTNNLSGDELLNISNGNNSGVYSGLKFRTRTSGAAHSLIGLRMDSIYTDAKFFIRLRNGGLTSQEVFNVSNTGAYFAGNVGIGTTSPTNGKLVINSTANQIAIETGTAGDGRLNIGHFANGTFIGTYGDDGGVADIIRFGTHSGDERMRIDSSGNVGIGTTSPAQKLDVAGKIVSSIDLTVGNNSSGAVRYSGQNGYYSFITRSNYNDWVLSLLGTDGDASTDPIGNQLMTVNYNGNVGIGAPSPAQKLQVTSSTGNAYIRYNNASYTGIDIGQHFGGNIYYWNRDATSQIWGNNSTEAMRINSAGNVGIGTTSPGSKLTVNGSFSADTGSFSNSLTLSSDLRLQNNITILNKAQSAYISFATRNTTGSEVVMDLTNVGSINGGAAGPYLPLSAGSSYPLTGALYLESSNTDVVMSGNTSGNFTIDNNTGNIAFKANGSSVQSMSITSSLITINEPTNFTSGNVGIGTTSPDAKLEVAATATTSVDIANFSNSNGITKIKHALDSLGSGTVSIFDASNNEDIRLSSQGNSWFNAGNVGIGTVTPNYKLSINGDFGVSNGGNIYIGGIGADSQVILLLITILVILLLMLTGALFNL